MYIYKNHMNFTAAILGVSIGNEWDFNEINTMLQVLSNNDAVLMFLITMTYTSLA